MIPPLPTWEKLKIFKKPFLIAISDSEPRQATLRFQREIKGAKNQRHFILKGANHFLQDDVGEVLANVVMQFLCDRRLCKKVISIKPSIKKDAVSSRDIK